MQDTEFFSNFPPSLAAKVQTYAAQLISKAQNICKHNGVAPDVADVFITDVLDMLRAQYCGLRATIEQMRALTERVPQRSWERTEQAPLGLVASYYGDIARRVESGTPITGYVYTDAVIMYETAKRAPAVVFAGYDEDATRREAQQLYYAYAVLSIGEWCDVTADELRQITRSGAYLNSDKQGRLIDEALRAQAWRKQIRQTQKEHAATAPIEQTGDIFPPDKMTTNRKAPATYAGNKTITYYQNFALAISNGIQTADNVPANEKDITRYRPIFENLAQQRQQALEMQRDATATNEQKLRAAELMANTYAVQQVIDGIQVLPQYVRATSGSTEYSGYDITPRELYRIATGEENPNSAQLLQFLRGIAWLDTQRISITEKVRKYVTTTGADGKRIRKEVERDVVTNFRPLNVVFKTEYEDGVPIQKATRLYVQLHNYMRSGVTREYIEDGGKRLYLKKPKQQYMQAGQYYQFTTEEERIFRSTILSKPKQAEDKLLAAVFGYDKRKAEAEQRAQALCTIADEMERNPTATAEQKQLARANAAAAQDNARRCITMHMGRDYDRLAAMFEKAQQCGLITYYFRRSAAGAYKASKYGRGFVWEWERPDAEEVKKQRGNR